MTPGATRIVTLFEDCNLTVEQIALDEGLDVAAVKATLLMCSTKFRSLSKEKQELDFTDEELAIANRTIVQTMSNTEDENLKVRCARYIRQDKKGRLDRTAFGKLNINVFQLNADMQKARAALGAAKQKVIDVVTESSEKKDLQPA